MLDDPIPSLKRQLADEILTSVAGLRPSRAALVLEIDDARMSDLKRGRVARFSIERLIRLLALVERRVDLTVVKIGSPRLAWFRLARERAERRRHNLASET
jgi:predicted XRE-type DNA-binding protein